MKKYTLIELRQMHGVSLRDVAAGIGTSAANVSRAERGIVVPNAQLSHALMLFYNVPYDQIEWPYEKDVTLNYNVKRLRYVR